MIWVYEELSRASALRKLRSVCAVDRACQVYCVNLGLGDEAGFWLQLHANWKMQHSLPYAASARSDAGSTATE